MVSEVLVFSLFSSKITLEDRSKIASWLLTMKVTIHETFTDKWEEDMDYRSTRELVKNVKVTNDVAERGVNMDSNFSKC